MNFEQYLIKEGVLKNTNVLHLMGEENLKYIWDNCDSLNEGVLDKLKSIAKKFGKHGKAVVEFFRKIKEKKNDPKVKELYNAIVIGAGNLATKIQNVLSNPKFQLALKVLALSPVILQLLGGLEAHASGLPDMDFPDLSDTGGDIDLDIPSMADFADNDVGRANWADVMSDGMGQLMDNNSAIEQIMDDPEKFTNALKEYQTTNGNEGIISYMQKAAIEVAQSDVPESDTFFKKFFAIGKELGLEKNADATGSLLKSIKSFDGIETNPFNSNIPVEKWAENTIEVMNQSKGSDAAQNNLETLKTFKSNMMSADTIEATRYYQKAIKLLKDAGINFN